MRLYESCGEEFETSRKIVKAKEGYRQEQRWRVHVADTLCHTCIFGNQILPVNLRSGKGLHQFQENLYQQAKHTSLYIESCSIHHNETIQHIIFKMDLFRFISAANTSLPACKTIYRPVVLLEVVV